MAFRFGSYRLLPTERRLERNGVPVSVGSRAFDLLTVLVEHGGEVVSKRELTSRAWPDTVVDEVSLRVHISALRKILGDTENGSPYIGNVSGRGYVLSSAVERDTVERGYEVPSSTSGTAPLPPVLQRMVGRDEAILEVVERVSIQRFVTIVGAGGMGKTTLSVAAAHRMIDAFRDGVAFIDLTSAGEGALVATTIASFLGVAVPQTGAAPVLCNFLKEKQLLLLLDNCEHVIDAIAELAEAIFQFCPGVCLLATSREALRVEGEYIFKIEPLKTPMKGAIGSAQNEFPALQLFLDRMSAAGADRNVSDADVELAAEICRRLDGMALAIELTASRAATHGLARTLELLDQRFGIHWGGRRTALPRHQTVLALHDWSYNLLNTEEKVALRRVGWLSGSFTMTAAKAVARADIEPALETLSDKSLIARVADQEGGIRYRLAETTRAYALDKLQRDPEELHSTALAHANFYLGLLKERSADASSFHISGVARYHPEALANVRTALSWCYGPAAEERVGAGLAAYSSMLFLELSLLGECFEWSDRAVANLPQEYEGSIVEALLHQARAVSGIIVKSTDKSVDTSFGRSLEIANRNEDLRLQIDTLAGWNIFVMRAGDCYQGMRLSDRALALCEASDDNLSKRLAGLMKGISLAYDGQLTDARSFLELGGADRPDVDTNLNLVAFTQHVRASVQLSRVLLLQGSAERAAKISRNAVRIADIYGHPIPRCIALAYSASTAIWAGDFRSAQEMITALNSLSDSHSLAAFNAVSIGLQAELRLYADRYDSTGESTEQAMTSMSDQNHHHMAGSFNAVLALHLAAVGHHTHALGEIEKAIQAGDTGGERFQKPDLLRIRGVLLASRDKAGDREEALASLSEALELAKESSALMYELNAALALDQLFPTQETEVRLASVSALFHENELEDYLSRAIRSLTICGWRRPQQMSGTKALELDGLRA